MASTDVATKPPPAYVRASTNATGVFAPTNIVSVGTHDAWPRDDWPRDAFFDWFDRVRPAAGFKNEYEFSRAAGISHSAISGWRSGRQRPSMALLSKVAKALDIAPREVWLKAGLVDEQDVAPASTRDDHEPAAADRRAIQLIRDSKLSEPAKRMLIDRYLEKVRRAERELREDIKVFEQN